MGSSASSIVQDASLKQNIERTKTCEWIVSDRVPSFFDLTDFNNTRTTLNVRPDGTLKAKVGGGVPSFGMLLNDSAYAVLDDNDKLTLTDPSDDAPEGVTTVLSQNVTDGKLVLQWRLGEVSDSALATMNEQVKAKRQAGQTALAEATAVLAAATYPESFSEAEIMDATVTANAQIAQMRDKMQSIPETITRKHIEDFTNTTLTLDPTGKGCKYKIPSMTMADALGSAKK